MIRRLLAGILVLGLVFLAFDYASAPVFWQRFLASLSASGTGAYSEVFDVQERVAGNPGSFTLPVATAENRSLDETGVADLIAYAEYYESFSLIVIHKGEVQLEWYREGYDAAKLTQSQSMHKSLQALLVGIMMSEGLIESVDDPIGAYLDELAADARGEITIRQLLRMTSGLRNFQASFNPWGDAFRWLYSTDTRSATLSFPQASPAGESFDYNDLNAQLLGLLLTEVSGKRYAQLLSEKLWRPLGNDDARVWLDREGGTAMHACCLLATSRDWARLGLMLLENGTAQGRQVVPEAWIASATSPSDLTPHYGYQIWLANNTLPNPRTTGYQRREDWLADDVFYFSGYGAQRVIISREKNLVIVRLGPAAGYFPKIIKEWDNAYLFNRAVRSIESIGQ